MLATRQDHYILVIYKKLAVQNLVDRTISQNKFLAIIKHFIVYIA